MKIPQIVKAHRQVLEQEITQQEIRYAIDKLNAGKAPGLDDLTSEIFKDFFHPNLQVLS